ncbi:terpene synthase family protein [Streptomyces daliensis]|uniref:Terpene synthase n=1 Tax=Streptomyces daliensis TaxID=299421 RepID=A0A8T4IPX7_9ACTN|nr:pentalenene synthase [Streptomyces daliensis]
MNGSAAVRRTALLDIPFSAAVNDSVETARRHTLRWLRTFGLLPGEEAAREYDALRLERLMAAFYPGASSADLCLACDFNGWFFVFDDQFDGRLGHRPRDVGPLVDRLVGCLGPAADSGSGLSTGLGADPPLVAAFRDVWLRASAGMPPFWRRRFAAHWRGYLESHRCEAMDRVTDEAPSLERFLRVRRHSIGVRPCLDYGERAGGCVLPEMLYSAPPLTTLRELTVDVVIFVNDLVSLDKELAVGDMHHNSVLVLRSRTGCSLEEATARVSRLVNTRVARFRQLADDLPRALEERATPVRTRADVARCLDTMRDVMSGNLAWSLETARYDASGVAAVSDGRERPWAGLVGSEAAVGEDGHGEDGRPLAGGPRPVPG